MPLLVPGRTTRPSLILFTAASVSLIISTFLASFWPEGDLDGLPVKGVALGDYTLWPLWVWIYCIIWWIIQVWSADAAHWHLILTHHLVSSYQLTVCELHTFTCWRAKLIRHP